MVSDGRHPPDRAGDGAARRELGAEIRLGHAGRGGSSPRAGGPPASSLDGRRDRSRADVVVANADWGYTQRELLARRRARRRPRLGLLRRALPGRGAGPVEGPHHPFLLSEDFAGNLDDIFERRCLPRASVHLPVAADRDRSVAGARRAPSSSTSSCRCRRSGQRRRLEGRAPGLPEEGLRPALARGPRRSRSARSLAETALTPGDVRHAATTSPTAPPSGSRRRCCSRARSGRPSAPGATAISTTSARAFIPAAGCRSSCCQAGWPPRRCRRTGGRPPPWPRRRELTSRRSGHGRASSSS